MKTKLQLLAITFCLAVASPSYGQGFLNKINKGLEKVNNELDKIAGKEPSSKGSKKTSKGTPQLADVANNSENEAYKGVLIRPFNPQINIELISCLRQGSKVTIAYMMTNNGPDFTISELGVSKNVINQTEETVIVDNNGRNCELRYYTFGGSENTKYQLTLLPGVPVRCELEIYNVASTAKSLALVNIAGYYKTNKPGTADESQYFSFAFKNVPIYTVEQTLQMMNPIVLTTIKLPYVEVCDENNVIESVQITDKYTKIDFTYTNEKYNPTAHLVIDPKNNPAISVNGMTYGMLFSKGITTRQGDVTIKYNGSGDYSLIFEPIPANTVSFNIDGENFSGVTLISDIDIPATKGIFPSLDVKYNAYYKQPRMTAAERTKYKIDNIKIKDFPTQIQNSQLAKGKTIYTCDKGRIVTFLFIVADQITKEYMVSYDPKGNVIDCIDIGTISAYGGDRGYADISGDKVVVYSSYPAEEGEDGDSVTEYRITPKLKFIKMHESK